MANEEHLRLLHEGTGIWNWWREKNPVLTPDLVDAKVSGADLPFVNLSGANLSYGDLSLADLTNANLSDANFSFTDLSEAILTDADLSYTDLSFVYLRRAKLCHAKLRDTFLFNTDLSLTDLSLTNLSGANLSKANFSGAKLEKGDLTDARLSETIFAGVNLSNVKGLETCQHDGPSIIDFSTLQVSWPLPEVFLRGIGLPDSYIEYLPSLIGSLEPIQFYSCFISYSHKDEEFAQRLYADLQSNGVRCWYAPEDMKGGKKIHHQIDDAIKVHDKLLLVLSEHSMKSSWVENEIVKARKRELTEDKQVLFPLGLCEFKNIKNWELFYADEGRDLGREIREYFIPDFSNWKDQDSYKKAFDKLLKDLKASAVKPGRNC